MQMCRSPAATSADSVSVAGCCCGGDGGEAVCCGDGILMYISYWIGLAGSGAGFRAGWFEQDSTETSYDNTHTHTHLYGNVWADYNACSSSSNSSRNWANVRSYITHKSKDGKRNARDICIIVL